MSATRVTGIVPAGGASRRMGTDKRLLVVDGEPMLRRVVAAVAAVADEVIVVVAADRPIPEGMLDGLEARVAIDRRADAGPLAAIEAGLLTARGERAVVVAGDLPWVTPSLLRRLLQTLEGDNDALDAAAAMGGHGAEPLLAAYRRDRALAVASALLDAEKRRATVLLEGLRVAPVPDDSGATRNVNEPADLVGGRR